MVEKVTHWTAEELAEIRRVQARAPRLPEPRQETWDDHNCPCDEHCQLCEEASYYAGAAACGGLIAMAMQILINLRTRGRCAGAYFPRTEQAKPEE